MTGGHLSRLGLVAGTLALAAAWAWVRARYLSEWVHYASLPAFAALGYLVWYLGWGRR